MDDRATIRFTVPGDPQPLRRHRTTRFGHAYDPAQNRDAKGYVRWAAREAMQGHDGLLDGPLCVSLEFTVRRPKSVPKRRAFPCVKPDLDNLEKLVFDALNGVVWRDDAQVVWCIKRKRYGDVPQTDVAVWAAVAGAANVEAGAGLLLKSQGVGFIKYDG